MGVILALISAMGFTFNAVFIRRGMMEEKPGSEWEIRFVALLVTLFVFFIGLLLATLFGFNISTEFHQLTAYAILLLFLEGTLGPLVGAFLMTTAIAQIGASHTSALWGGSNPLFATILAIVFLGERPNLLGMIAVMMVVLGIIIVGYRSHTGTIGLLEKTRIAGGIFALLSGLSFALSQIARGAAINYGATPNTAIIIGGFSALVIITVCCYLKSRDFSFLQDINIKSLLYYSSSGVGALVGRYSILTAFMFIPVWQAVAIRNIQPLLAIILSSLILKNSETINLRLIGGTVLLTSGIILLSIF